MSCLTHGFLNGVGTGTGVRVAEDGVLGGAVALLLAGDFEAAVAFDAVGLGGAFGSSGKGGEVGEGLIWRTGVGWEVHRTAVERKGAAAGDEGGEVVTGGGGEEEGEEEA